MAHAVVIGILLAVILGLQANGHKPDQRLEALRVEMAKLNAAHAAMVAELELTIRLTDFKSNIRTMTPEDARRQFQDLTAECKAFLAKYPAQRNPEIDDFANKGELVVDDIPDSLQRIKTLENLEKSVTSFIKVSNRMTPQERKQKSEELLANYRAFTEKNQTAEHPDGEGNARVNMRSFPAPPPAAPQEKR